MTIVFLKDMFSIRHVVGNVVLWAAAAYMGWMLHLPINPVVLLSGLAASTAVGVWLLMSSVWTFDRLKDYAQLPVSRRRFFVSFSTASWVVMMGDIALPIVFFSLTSSTNGIWTVAASLAACYATVCLCLFLWLAVHEKGGLIGLLLGSLLMAGGCALVYFFGLLGVGVTCVLWVGAAWLWFSRSQGFFLIRHRSTTVRVGRGNYFATVSLAQPTLLINGAFLLVFSGIVSVMSMEYGIPLPLGFVIFSVSSPVATLMSVDTDLQLQWRMLGKPNQLLVQYRWWCCAYFGSETHCCSSRA